MPMLGPTELIVILVIVILIFGAGKISTLGSAMGRTIHDFRKEVSGDESKSTETAAPQTPASITAGQTTGATGGVFCSSCGAGMSAEAKFCPSCGVAAPSSSTPAR